MADNKDIIRRGLEGFWTNPDVLDEVISPDYVGYDPAAPEPIRGVEGAKANLMQYKNAFEDARITITEQVAEGDLVASRWEGRGRHTGELMGVPPSGNDIVVEGFTFSRMKDGKIVEDRTVWDTLGMLQQIGAIPTMATAQTR
jgi:steroid delta-isomerase-like uncharacterized protein